MKRLGNYLLLAGMTLAAFRASARVGTLVQQAPRESAARANPLEGQARAQLAGAKLFARECAACHGAKGSGLGKAPPLNQTDVGEAAPGALYWILRNGSLQRGMPSFAHLPPQERWQIVTFVKSLTVR